MAELVITDLRGRNGTDQPLSLPDWQCCEAMNVDLSAGRMGTRRAGSASLSLTFSSGGPFTSGLGTVLRHVPAADETAAELWAIDVGTGLVGRLAASTQWTAPTLKDSVANALEITGASLGGYFWLTYNSAAGGNRSYVYDTSTVRRRGLATPAAPTVATLGGAGLTITRYYRVRWVHISGSDTVRRSEPSTVVSLSITDDAGIRVTRPSVANEGETHWEPEYAASADGPWYRASQVAIATTTYDDTAAAIDDTNLSAEDGLHYPPPAFKYNVKAGARLLCAGAWDAVAGSSFIPRNNEVYWTPTLGATDVGDLERQPVSYRVSLDHPVIGLSEAVSGIHFAFGYRGISALVPTQDTAERAFERYTRRMDIGALRHQVIVVGEDELGRECLYFLSHRGPYRIGAQGIQYLGADIEDIWETVNLDAAEGGHGTFYADMHQVWWWIATSGASTPNKRLRFFTQLGRSEGDEVRGGWVVDSGDAVNARCSTTFASTVGASMTRALKPYFGSTSSNAIYKGNTGTDDGGTDYQAYVDTKEYAPAGLGRNVTLGEPHLIAEAATALVSVTARTDFGADTNSIVRSVSVAAQGGESHVHRKLEGFQGSELGTVRFRVGDEVATDPGFASVDVLVVPWEPAGLR